MSDPISPQKEGLVPNEDDEMRARSASGTRVKVLPVAAPEPATVQEAVANNAVAAVPTEPETPPLANADTPAESAPATPSGSQPAWPLFLGFASFGLSIGLVAGLSPVSGISEKLMASLFSFVGGILLTYTGFQLSDKAGKPVISTTRVGGSLCSFSLALCLGIGLGATERIRDPLRIRPAGDGGGSSVAPVKLPGSAPAAGGAPAVASAQPAAKVPAMIINSRERDLQASVREKLRKGEYEKYPKKNLIDELSSLSDSCTTPDR